MGPATAWDILYYYGGVIGVGLLLFFVTGRKKKGMRLRLRGGVHRPRLDQPQPDNVIDITTADMDTGKFSHISKGAERPLNVIFNYNGESWDAYEVLGLPAGSSPEKVEQAYRAALASVDAGSRPFLQAAYQAIQTDWKTFKASGSR